MYQNKLAKEIRMIVLPSLKLGFSSSSYKQFKEILKDIIVKKNASGKDETSIFFLSFGQNLFPCGSKSRESCYNHARTRAYLIVLLFDGIETFAKGLPLKPFNLAAFA
jgi:hypothetical protein